MSWSVSYDEEFASWLLDQSPKVRLKIEKKIELLEEFGPGLGRPTVDTVYGSAFENMKELRVQVEKRPYRILFAFDPERRAFLLVAGDKGTSKRWYEVHIPIADERFRRHLEAIAARGKLEE